MSHVVTIDEITGDLRARCAEVARDYAPGGFVDHGKYWALNPGRADKTIGSFYVSLSGPYQGRWREEATGDHGDMLDLIQLARNCNTHEAIEEAKRFLGIIDETPEMRQRRKERREKADAAAEAEHKAWLEKREARRRQAHAIYLEAEAKLEGTPVDHYLAGRAIHLAQLPRNPNVIRYHPNLSYYHVDKSTGEVFEGKFPAMVAAIHAGHAPGEHPPRFIGIHKTYLSQRSDGTWGKAPVPKPKLIWGQKQGGYIRVWAGIGPRGGKPGPISKAAAGSKLYVAEGIEDALSVVMLKRDRRVAAAVDLGNILAMSLPPAIHEVVIVADNDPDPEQIAAIDLAAERFAKEGRRVRVWRNDYGGKDLNDALMMAAARDA